MFSIKTLKGLSRSLDLLVRIQDHFAYRSETPLRGHLSITNAHLRTTVYWMGRAAAAARETNLALRSEN